MSEKYPVAIWGVGPAGGNYLRAMCQDWRLNVVGLINRNEERRNKASKQTGVPGFANLQDLLANGTDVRPVKPGSQPATAQPQPAKNTETGDRNRNRQGQGGRPENSERRRRDNP